MSGALSALYLLAASAVISVRITHVLLLCIQPPCPEILSSHHTAVWSAERTLHYRSVVQAAAHNR